jgi:hypothetical protein
LQYNDDGWYDMQSWESLDNDPEEWTPLGWAVDDEPLSAGVQYRMVHEVLYNAPFGYCWFRKLRAYPTDG